MKKTLVVITLILMLTALMTLTAQDEKRVNVLANLGFAFSDFEGMFFDIGAEMQFSEKIYGQLLFDYYFNPSGEDLGSGVDDSAYGINLYGVYKMGEPDAMSFFVKAGVHYTTIKASGSAWGVTVSATSSDFGIGGGAGFEYPLSDNMGLNVGGTVKLIFAEGDTGTWFKLYGGISYRIK